MSRLSVVIVDDHTLFRTGLQELLASRDISVVAMTGRPQEAEALVVEHQPDIVLLDLRMKEMTGLEVLKAIRAVLPEQRVVILTTSVEEQDLLEALRLGAVGYLLKDTEPDTLAEMLQQACQGEMVIAQDMTKLLAKAVSSPKPEVPKKPIDSYNLTPREMDILKHVAKGESNREIAESLGIVDGTVKLHVRAVLKKLGVQSRVQAAVLAVSEKLCEEEE